MQNVFFISDCHFNHARIIELANRPFSSVEEMDQTLIDNWNRAVKYNDTVYFLGDFCWSKNNKDANYYLKQLNGRKHLILGNHDNVQEMSKLGIHYVLGHDYSEGSQAYWESIDHYLEIRYNHKKFVLFHYKIEDWNGCYHNSIALHGHVHQNNGILKKNRFNVSVENINYTPIEMSELLEKNTNSK